MLLELPIARGRARVTPVLALTFIVSSASMSWAQFYQWTNSGGGNYAASSNWDPIGVPDTDDEAATFNLNATYNVQVGANTIVGGLTLLRGGATFEFQPTGVPNQRYLYSTANLIVAASTGGATTMNIVNGGLGTVFNTTVGTVGSNGQIEVNLVNSNLTSGAAQIGSGGNSVGRLIVDDTSHWSVAGTTALGGAGDVTFELKADFGSSSFGPITTYFPTQGVATNAGVVMAQSATSDATATIYGSWNTGDLIVGSAGHATLSVLATQRTAPNGTGVSSAGILASGTVSIAAQPGSSATVNVTGLALNGFVPLISQWTITDSLAVGGTSAAAGGAGGLVIGGANTVSVGAGLKLWPGATLRLGEFSNLTVSGPASLGGRLEFVLPVTTIPQAGNEFDILSAAGGVTGAFASSLLPTLNNGLRWIIVYEPTSVSLVVAPALAADFDENGTVNGFDLTERWKSNFGLATGASHAQGDANADGRIDGADLLIWQQQVGSGHAVATVDSVPEPSTTILMLFVAWGGFCPSRPLSAQ